MGGGWRHSVHVVGGAANQKKSVPTVLDCWSGQAMEGTINAEHLPVQNPHKTLMGARPVSGKLVKGPWWKICVRFPSCILVGPGGEIKGARMSSQQQ